MAIEGPLQELGLHDVLQLLELSRKTGILTVRSGHENDEGAIHMDVGEIVFGRRRRSRLLLGQRLLRAGKLTEGELTRALDLQRRSPDRRLSELLLEMGSTTEEELRSQLRLQLEENVCAMMNWGQGHFRFEEREDVFRSGIPVRLRVETVLIEGARRLDETRRGDGDVPDPDAIPVLVAGPEAGTAPLALGTREWEVLAAVDGRRSLADIAGSLKRSTLEVARVVHGLADQGIVRVRSAADVLPERELRARLVRAESLLAAGLADQAEAVVAELEASSPERADVALLVGRARAAQGRAGEAADAFARAVALAPLLPAAHRHLGLAAVSTGDFGRAEQAWSSYMEIAPASVERDRVQRGLAAVRALVEILGEGKGRPPT